MIPENQAPGRASASSLREVSLADRGREWLKIARLLWSDDTEHRIGDLRKSYAEHDAYARKYLGKPLTACKVIEIGFGARPNRLTWFAGQGVDIVGVDLDRPIMTGVPGDFLHIYRRNGAVRALKSLGRWLLSERSQRKQLLATISRERGKPFVFPAERMIVTSATGPAFWQSHPGADYIFSEDVFEHIDASVIEQAIGLMAASMARDGVAFLKPNVYTGITGGHHIEWYPHTFEQPMERTTGPWEHLRQNRHPADTYLNKLRRADYRELFGRYFDILDERETQPRLGEQFMTPDLREELRDYPDEELYSNSVAFVCRPK